ncbi:MAG: 16S rRNA (uracil(1498)-N(3))-methyltransferase [Deltaproteobacteria bacterium]|nr:16S rRNA (uracil(1498)-N(3))-methyltransferase [Deltaproteobacteria bacterium]
MRRFFVEDIREDSATVEVAGPEFRHLGKALRLREGAIVSLFNGNGLELTGRVETIDAGRAVVRVGSISWRIRESPADISLVAGLVKGEKPDLIIQKATELGIKEITFYPADRSVPVADEAKADERLVRWRRIAVEAAKQCGRTVLPEIDIAPGLKAAIAHRDGLLKVFFWEGEKKRRFSGALSGQNASRGAVLLIGPEGGFSDEEARIALEAGFVSVSLGPRTLRAETAAIAAMVMAQHALGDMG